LSDLSHAGTQETGDGDPMSIVKEILEEMVENVLQGQKTTNLKRNQNYFKITGLALRFRNFSRLFRRT
jgi:hypothetical protein